ncbi:MAG TPA: SIS domain-containing protein [Bacilli bacterium]|nr:SIS domain-containing protein [Bacilli bacterium]
MKINEFINLELSTITNLPLSEINQLIDKLNDALINKQRIYLLGNGGSSASAAHICNDFNKLIFNKTENRFQIINLCSDTSYILAIANDISYEEIFKRQMFNSLTSNDLVIALSGSGNSKNVINAIKYASEMKAYTIGLSGYDGGELNTLVDLGMHINVNNMQVVEDMHMMIFHLIYNYFINTYEEKSSK